MDESARDKLRCIVEASSAAPRAWSLGRFALSCARLGGAGARTSIVPTSVVDPIDLPKRGHRRCDIAEASLRTGEARRVERGISRAEAGADV